VANKIFTRFVFSWLKRLRRDVAAEMRDAEMDFSPFLVRFERRRLLLGE
jgi:hypothetical protein